MPRDVRSVSPYMRHSPHSDYGVLRPARSSSAIIAGVVFTVISVVTLSGSDPAAKPPASPTPPSPASGSDVPHKAAMVNAGTSPRTPDEEALLRMSLGDLVEGDETFPSGRDAMGNPYGGQYGRRDRI